MKKRLDAPSSIFDVRPILWSTPALGVFFISQETYNIPDSLHQILLQLKEIWKTDI